MNPSPDKILVSAIDCVAAVGVSAEERATRQRLLVDVEVTADLKPAALSDALGDSVDYAEIVKVVVALALEREYHLIETLAERIAARVLSQCGGQEVRVRIRKMTAPLSARVGFVGIEIFRRASDRV